MRDAFAAWSVVLLLAACGGGAAQRNDNSSNNNNSNNSNSSNDNNQDADGPATSSSQQGSCASGQVECPMGCFDIDNDPSNCGSCGYACKNEIEDTTAACVAGKCVPKCNDASETYCHDDEECYDLQTDAHNCGQCDNSCKHAQGPECQSSTTCTAGTCQFSADATLNGSECTGKDTVCYDGSCDAYLAKCTSDDGDDDDFDLTIPGMGDDDDVFECGCSGNNFVYDDGTIACGSCVMGTFSDETYTVLCLK